MNHFEYKIFNAVYNDIKNGKKTIEFRLLNDKSESINIGDEIRFNVLNSDKYLLVEVTNKYYYDTLDELWNSKEVLKNCLDYSKEEFIATFNDIFGKDKVKSSKIIGIEFR